MKANFFNAKRVVLTLLAMLTICMAQVLADPLKTSDLDFGTPDVDVTFESLSTTTINATSSAQTTNTLSGCTPFDKAYIGSSGNGAQSIAIASSSGAMTSQHMAFVFTNNGIATTFDHDFEDKGAFSFKVLKASTVNIGIYSADAYYTGSTVFSHAAASVFLQCTSSKISLSAGRTSGTPNKWQTVTESLPSADVLEIHVVYNNTSTADEYGDGITIAAKTAHVFINGNAEMDDDVPKAFYINGNDLTSFRICGQTASTSAKIDDIKIYDALPGAGKTLSSIAKKTDATKTAYIEGEKFNPAGLVITATYSDKSTEDIAYTGNEAKFSFSPTTATALTTSNTSVTVTYGGQTCSQSINVYSITLQAKDEDGNSMGVGAPGAPTFNGSTGQITAAADAANYVFKEWVVSNATASTTTASPSTLSSPTGAVTVTAKYYKPISVCWKVNGEDWTPSSGGGTDGTATVGYGTAWSTLTLPTDPIPGTDEDACGNKFIGWTDSEIDGELDKTDDAAAITTLNSKILNSSTKSGKTSTYITTATTFHAVFADYAE